MSDETTVRSYLKELNKIYLEDKKLDDQRKLLKLRKVELEAQVLKYIKEKQIPGVKYENIEVLSKEKKQRIRMTKNEKEDAARKILEDSGISNSQEVLKKMFESMKGEEITVDAIKIKRGKS